MKKLMLFAGIFLFLTTLIFADDVPDSPWKALKVKCGTYTYKLESAKDMDFFSFKIDKDVTILFKFSAYNDEDEGEYIDVKLRKYSNDYSEYDRIDSWYKDVLDETYLKLKKGIYAFVFYKDSNFKKEITYTFTIDSPTCDLLGGTEESVSEKTQEENLNPANSDDYQKGFNDGIEYCKKNPDKCGFSNDCQEEYKKGYEDGKNYCKENPENCEISCAETTNNPFISPSIDQSCGYYNFLTSALHIPCIKIGEDKFWFNFKVETDKCSNVYLKIDKYGKTYSQVDCSKFNEEDCKKYSNMCEWQPGVFGVLGKCVSKK